MAGFNLEAMTQVGHDLMKSHVELARLFGWSTPIPHDLIGPLRSRYHFVPGSAVDEAILKGMESAKA